MDVMEINRTMENFAQARRAMVQNDLKARGITDPGVLSVMGRLGREQFVPPSYRAQAYADNPLPVGMGQTISQPYIVALMTQLLRLTGYCDVLEVGTGSGYQTAVIAFLSRKVYTMERCGALSEGAQAVLGRLGIDNVEFCIGDGTGGWPDPLKLDRVLVTAAAPRVPPPLLDCLAEGGIMVVPVGSTGIQQLMVLEKGFHGVTETAVCDVRFVPLVGQYGFRDEG